MARPIDSLARDLFAPLLAERQSEWELVSLEVEQGFSVILQRGEEYLLVELEPLDTGRDCFSRTKRFNVCVRRPFDPRAALDVHERRVAEQVVEMIGRREGRLPQFERPTSARARAVREIEVERVLMPEGRGLYYLNPYVGCMIGCPFCYVARRADLSRALEGLPSLPWGRYVDVKINAPEVLREEVQKYPPGIVRMSPILTDPYQPLERNYRITRQCLEVLAGAGFTAAVLTRAGRVVDDLEVFSAFEKSGIGFSIPTDDDRIRQIFEPGADPIEERLQALRKAKEVGLATVAFIQPILPMDPSRLVKLVAPHVRAVRIDRMYEMETMRQVYLDNGMEYAASDGFFEEKILALRREFEAAGVPIDDMDDLQSVF